MSEVKLPVTRYYGSKRKLVKSIWEEIEKLGIEFNSVLDVFGGSAIFSYYAKTQNKSVIYNDIFRFNYLIGKALIENISVELTDDDIINLLVRQEGRTYNNLIERHFKDIYYPDHENVLIDVITQNISTLDNENKRASAYYLLIQSCLIKRPYNLFHRKNLNMRIDFKGGKFGNKITWERSFEELFLRFYKELKELTFNNFNANQALNSSALHCQATADLIYIDPPYFKKNNHVPYHSKYHFLEGLANYEEIENQIDHLKKNKEIQINKSHEFETRNQFMDHLEALIQNHRNSSIAISYRSDGIPSVSEIAELLSGYRRNTEVINLGKYNYALTRNHKENCEYLFIG